MKALKITPIVILLKPYSFIISVAVLARLTRSRYGMRYIKQRRSSTTQRTWLRPDDSSFSISIPPSPCGKSDLTRMLVAVVHIYTAKSLAAMFFRRQDRTNSYMSHTIDFELAVKEVRPVRPDEGRVGRTIGLICDR